MTRATPAGGPSKPILSNQVEYERAMPIKKPATAPPAANTSPKRSERRKFRIGITFEFERSLAKRYATLSILRLHLVNRLASFQADAGNRYPEGYKI
jgi:hypothetical protein